MKSKAEDMFEKRYIKEDKKLQPIDYLTITAIAIVATAITWAAHIKTGVFG
ncbi:hypothetical protein [Agarilytica rhodophyticola]|uniref:hypothetical protein n=1 Tax=Agarilytica rhodophyticola TaxID=1737490 RepID=UPI00131A42C9|nr:hypothetical protein [Agarilytica rhodophyticola]